MKRKVFKMLITIGLCSMFMTGCGQADTSGVEEEVAQMVTEAVTETQEYLDQEVVEKEEENVNQEAEPAEDAENEAKNENADVPCVRIGGLKGPTSMGMAQMLAEAADGNTGFTFEFTMGKSADEIAPLLLTGKLDMAAVPCNLASVLYNKSEGKVVTAAVNTLGVLSIVTKDSEVKSFEDLKGKTIYATGQGTTPEYSLRYLLTQNGMDPDKDIQIEWKSEATEIVSLMQETEGEVIAMLPQPFVTVAMTQIEGLEIAIDFNNEWNNVTEESMLVTGVLVTTKDYIEQNEDTLKLVLEAYEKSVDFVNNQPEEASVLIEQLDIVKAPIAQKAIPNCHITFMTGELMKKCVNGYLQVLYEQNPESVGQNVPGDDFYYESMEGNE